MNTRSKHIQCKQADGVDKMKTRSQKNVKESIEKLPLMKDVRVVLRRDPSMMLFYCQQEKHNKEVASSADRTTLTKTNTDQARNQTNRNQSEQDVDRFTDTVTVDQGRSKTNRNQRMKRDINRSEDTVTTDGGTATARYETKPGPKTNKKNNQIVRKYIFKANQIVWAKMKGYPAWPAQFIHL
ncbi:uncharacterized protein LOC116347736 [Contarinia nasturtii]|uniref:uncharacterized protein LOC116347736 n=1 Tax=Contarinia nasturtii TaxID=265458 RepID=UPI0012D4B1F9|nr:uncharacterized protein LOC116347736 [Contarinia nasturtii]